jgi:arsenate reductase
MAEGFLRTFDQTLQVFSAGTKPAANVNPFAVKVTKEIGIDISNHRPKDVGEFLNQPFDYVITVCDNARETCPVFIGPVKHRLHLGIEDPTEARGTDDEVTAVFRQVRDRIRDVFHEFHSESLHRSAPNE